MSLCSSGTYILRFFWQAANENLPPNVIKQLAKELKNLNETPPEGIKVIVNDDDFSTIYADIEGPGRSQPWTALFLTASSFWYHGWRVVYVSEHCSWNSLREWYFPHEVVIISWLPSVTAQRYAFYTRYKTVPVYCMTFLIKNGTFVSSLLHIFIGYFMTKIFHPNIATNGEICVNTLKKDWNPSLGLRHVLTVSCQFGVFPQQDGFLKTASVQSNLDLEEWHYDL